MDGVEECAKHRVGFTLLPRGHNDSLSGSVNVDPDDIQFDCLPTGHSHFRDLLVQLDQEHRRQLEALRFPLKGCFGGPRAFPSSSHDGPRLSTASSCACKENGHEDPFLAALSILRNPKEQALAEGRPRSPYDFWEPQDRQRDSVPVETGVRRGGRSVVKSSLNPAGRSTPRTSFCDWDVTAEDFMGTRDDFSDEADYECSMERRSGVVHGFRADSRMLVNRCFRAWVTLRSFKLRPQWLREPQSMNPSIVEQGGALDDDRSARTRVTTHPFVMDPSGMPRVCWDIAGAVMLAYDVVLVPMAAFNLPTHAFLTFMSTLGLVYWTFDMFMSSFTGYIHRGESEMRLPMIVRRYFRTWFPLDLMVMVPEWTWYMAGSEDSGSSIQSVLRLSKFFRLVRLVRMMKFRRLMDRVRDRIESEVMFIVSNIFKLLLLLFMVNHYLASTWYLIGTWGQSSNRPNWVDTEFANTGIPYHYFTSVHWSLTQFTPGSMNVQPQNTLERAFAIAVLIFGLVLFSSFVSNITASMTQLRSMSEDSSKEFWLLRRFLRQRSVPSQLSFRILRFLEHASVTQTGMVQEGNVKLLALLSNQLHNELQMVVQFSVLMLHPLFAKLGEMSSHTVQQLTVNVLSRQYFAASDLVFKLGSRATSMYIVDDGQLSYARVGITDSVTHNSTHGRNTWLSEPALWTSWNHIGSAVARQNCALVSINANAFASELQNDGICWRLVAQYAGEYLHWMNSLQCRELSDIGGSSLPEDVERCRKSVSLGESGAYRRRTTVRLDYLTVRQMASQRGLRVSPSFGDG